jgi:hypothetical protein
VTTPKQSRNEQGGEPALLDRSQSDDSKQSVAFLEQLRAEAQAPINAGRHPNEIGAAVTGPGELEEPGCHVSIGVGLVAHA